MGEKKPAEPMGLAVMRERFRLASKSSVVQWEPSEVESMALTLEALAEVQHLADREVTRVAEVGHWVDAEWVARMAIAVARVRR